MNGSKILLDTNIIIALFGQDKAVLTHLQRVAEVFIPVVAVGELYYEHTSLNEESKTSGVFKSLLLPMLC